ncbi:MAG: ribosome-binding factor A [Minisyncoccia bacterium]
MITRPDKASSPDRHGAQRAEEMLTHAAAEFIVRQSNGTSLITATRTEIKEKGRKAIVYVTVFPEDRLNTALEFLNRQKDDFRDYLKTHARLRDLPRVTFVFDEGERNRQRLDELGRAL